MNSDQIPEENNATPAPSVKIQCPNCHADIFGVGSSFGIKTPPPSEGEKSLGQLWCDSAFEKAKELLPHVPYNSWEKLSPYEKDIAEHASQAVISAAVEREKKLAELNEMIVLKQARQILDLRKQLAQANERAEKAEAIIVANRVVIQDREDEIAKLQGESGLAEKRAIKAEKDAKRLAKALEWTLNEIGIPSHKSDDLEGYEGRKAAEEALASHNDSTGEKG